MTGILAVTSAPGTYLTSIEVGETFKKKPHYAHYFYGPRYGSATMINAPSTVKNYALGEVDGRVGTPDTIKRDREKEAGYHGFGSWEEMRATLDIG